MHRITSTQIDLLSTKIRFHTRKQMSAHANSGCCGIVMEKFRDLFEDVKTRTVLYFLLTLFLSSILSLTYNFTILNIPASLLLLLALRYVILEAEVQKMVPIQEKCYSPFFGWKKPHPTNVPVFPLSAMKRWKRKIDSVVIAAAVNEFIHKIVDEFVRDWYSLITPDKDFPDQIQWIIKDVIGEIYQRIKHIDAVELLMRDVANLIGNHIELYRTVQKNIKDEACIDRSFEIRDEQLKTVLIHLNELHPALNSPEAEYKVLKQLMGGLVAVVLQQEDVASPLVRCIAREILASAVLQPVMDLARPEFVNELIELLTVCTDKASKDHSNTNHLDTKNESQQLQNLFVDDRSTPTDRNKFSVNGMPMFNEEIEIEEGCRMNENNSLCTKNQNDLSALNDQPEFLEKKNQYSCKSSAVEGIKYPLSKCSSCATSGIYENLQNKPVTDTASVADNEIFQEKGKMVSFGNCNDNSRHVNQETKVMKFQHRRSKSLGTPSDCLKIIDKKSLALRDTQAIKETKASFYPESSTERRPLHSSKKLECQVIGVHFQKVGLKSIAIYSIAVANSEKKTWFVHRRFQNFEQLHRHLREIPNYKFNLPPKRLISSNNDDVFIQNRCYLLDKYLKGLLSVPNIAEQHEVWDFLSATSKNYSVRETPSVIKTLAFNMDDAMVDIVRQLKGVSSGLRDSISTVSPASSAKKENCSNYVQGVDENLKNSSTAIRKNRSVYDSDDSDEIFKINEESHFLSRSDGWQSDFEVNENYFSFHSNLQSVNVSSNSNLERSQQSEDTVGTSVGEDFSSYMEYLKGGDSLDDRLEAPPEWTSQRLIIPLLSLADRIFQLEKCGLIRRPLLWLGKKLLVLVMEDAIDNYILHQLDWLKKEDVVAACIRYIQNVLLDSGILSSDSAVENQTAGAMFEDFAVNPSETTEPFTPLEEKMESAERVHKIILEAPETLVRIIGKEHYNSCANDVYFFLQSTVCVKQLAYGLLELLLVTIFPELQEYVSEIHNSLWQ